MDAQLKDSDNTQQEGVASNEGAHINHASVKLEKKDDAWTVRRQRLVRLHQRHEGRLADRVHHGKDPLQDHDPEAVQARELVERLAQQHDGKRGSPAHWLSDQALKALAHTRPPLLPAEHATERLFPKAMVFEMLCAHQLLQDFIKQCEQDAASLQDPISVMHVYRRNFAELCALVERAAYREQFNPSETEPLDQELGAIPLAELPSHPAVTVCACYIVKQLCEIPHLWPAFQSELLVSFITTLEDAIFDASVAAEPGFCPPTPYATRLRHLRLANERIHELRARAHHRIEIVKRSLDAVGRHADKRATSLAFRAWRHTARLSKLRARTYNFALRARKEANDGRRNAGGQASVLVFFVWRAWARNQRLQRLLETEVLKLSSVAAELRTELSNAHHDEATLMASVRALYHGLGSVEQKRVSRPIRLDPRCTNYFARTLLHRCVGELEATDALTFGRFELFCLAPRWQFVQNPFSDEVDVAIAKIGALGARGVTESAERDAILADVERLSALEQHNEQAAYDELDAMSVEDVLFQWVNFALQTVSSRLPMGDANALSVLGARAGFKTRLRNLLTDLRDSEIMIGLLDAVAPDTSTVRIVRTLDVRDRAAQVLEVMQNELGCRRVITVHEYVGGVPDLSLLLLASLFEKNGHGAFQSVPDAEWSVGARAQISRLVERWGRLSSVADAIPQRSAYAFLADVQHVALQVSVVRERALRRDAQWQRLSGRVRAFMLALQRARINAAVGNGRPYAPKHVATAVARDLVDARHIRLLLHDADTEDQRIELEIVRARLKRHHGDLLSILKYYSAESESHLYLGVNLEQFVALVRDCNMLSGHHALTMTTVTNVFDIARRSAQDASDDAALSAAIRTATEVATGTPSATTKEVIAPESIVFGLLQISELYYRGSSHMRLSERFVALLTREVLPCAGRLEVDEFRKMLASDAVRSVFQTHQQRLTSIFKRYASLDEDAAKTKQNGTGVAPANVHTMSFAEFLHLAMDAHLLDILTLTKDASRDEAAHASAQTSNQARSTVLTGQTPASPSRVDVHAELGRLTEKRLRIIFFNAQQDELFGAADDHESHELSYQEFLEVLAACAPFRVKDPFLPLHIKLDDFLKRCVLQPLYGRKRSRKKRSVM